MKLLSDIFEKLYSRSVYLTGRYISDKKNPYMRLMLICVALVLIFSFPRFDELIFKSGFYERSCWDSIDKQIKDPFVNPHYPGDTHESKILYRFSVPLIANLFGFDYRFTLIFQLICGFLIFYMFSRIIHKITGDINTTVFLTVALSFIYAGKQSFFNLEGAFDGVAICFLLFAVYFRNIALMLFCLIFAYYTDERALIVSSFIILYESYVYNNKLSLRSIFNVNLRILTIIASWVIYFSVRYFLMVKFGFDTPNGGLTGIRAILAQLNNFPDTVWSALEGYWLIIIMVFIVAVKNKQNFFIMIYFILIAFYSVASMSVFDTTRSIIFIFPCVFIAIYILTKNMSIEEFRKLSFLVLLLCFIFPTYCYMSVEGSVWTMPLPVQLYKIIVAYL